MCVCVCVYRVNVLWIPLDCRERFPDPLRHTKYVLSFSP